MSGLLLLLQRTSVYLPHFFVKFKYSEKATKVTQSYFKCQENIKENVSNLHIFDSHIQKPISDQTRTFLERIFSVEIEFYKVYKQRLHNQLKSVESLEKIVIIQIDGLIK